MIKTAAMVGLVALQGAALVAADASAATSGPVATGTKCSGGGNSIAITLDASGSVDDYFEEARDQVINFVDSTSGYPDVNNNRYHLSFFSNDAFGGTGPLQNNRERQVTKQIDDFVPNSFGGTNTLAGMEDLENAFKADGDSSGARFAIVITDGKCQGCSDAELQEAGDRLRALGATVVGIGIGTYPYTGQLEALADTEKLVFTGKQFDEIKSLLQESLSAAGYCPVETTAEPLPESGIDLGPTSTDLTPEAGTYGPSYGYADDADGGYGTI